MNWRELLRRLLNGGVVLYLGCRGLPPPAEPGDVLLTLAAVLLGWLQLSADSPASAPQRGP